MEDNKLNFNRPLLSVRRFSSTVSSQKEYSKRKNGISPSPSYKSGSLRNAGSVPFVWEHSPGKPKDETKTQKQSKNLVPKLPPGRISKPKKQGPQTEVKFSEFESSKEIKKESSDTEVRKQVSNKKPLEVKKVVNRENERPQITYGPNFLQFTGDDSEEDSDIDYDEHENTSYKVCGLLPHFCLKGSIGLLNPLPGLSVRTRLPISSSNKTRSGSSSSSSTSSQPARVAVYEHRSLANQQKDETVLKNESKEATNQKHSQNLERSGPSDCLQDHVVSNNDIINSENKEVNLQKKGLISFKELLAVENEKETMVEKTLYVDTIHKVETPKTCENDEGIFGISNITTDPLLPDLLADGSKQDKELITETGFCEDPKVDQDLKVSRQSEVELPAPPPLPKSPSDSWLWRTLPSVSSKTPSKYPSSNSRAKPEKFELRNPQGQLLPIPEI